MAQDTRIRAQLREKNQLTLPREVRQALHISAGDDVDFVIGPDGAVRLMGLRTVPAEQAWFWENEWQTGEREASAELARGEGTVYGSAEEMFSALERPEAGGDQ
ncbi:hypothetical protein GCM10010329_08220 [Streptomyces spiroverticillatus]|uniref:SpoVT-AbrB domain-containing protein n=1 Tax=Streptomyces finlayi TaxID=67296 RepID=A0A918WTE8_9ACTN|nr:AbrB/MazE/SpoVT family DNA-binding domain-containing protein [Streptomyces finlayi]GGZ90071.1 hypothetical protein GCM10010329_08220 [Streptomyces spiroverticillatus]GHC80856.1 hypothetical protein GCM10010334_08210 [Streptomyces finlayi]